MWPLGNFDFSHELSWGTGPVPLGWQVSGQEDSDMSTRIIGSCQDGGGITKTMQDDIRAERLRNQKVSNLK